jgi:hypothetical protein
MNLACEAKWQPYNNENYSQYKKKNFNDYYLEIWKIKDYA